MNAAIATPTTPQITNPTATATQTELSRLRAAVTDAHARGFHTITCDIKEKSPWARYSPHAYLSATNDLTIALKPYTDGYFANYGVSGKHSNLVILDIDKGFACESDFNAWMVKHNLPPTYTVRSGKRTHKDGTPAFAVHLYYQGQVKDGLLPFSDVSGEIKSEGGYVCGSGSVHPDSGELYETLRDISVAPLPDSFRAVLGKPKSEHLDPKSSGIIVSRNPKVPEGERWKTLQRKAGALRNVGLNEDAIYNALKSYALDQYTDGENFIVEREADIRENAHAAYTKFEKTPEPEEKEPFKLWTLAELRAEREASSHSQDVVQGLITQKTVNIGLGDSGLGKTPFFLQMALCIAFGLPFLNQEVQRGKVLIADYENYGDTDKTLDALAGFLKIPTGEIDDGTWVRVARNLDQKSLELAIADFRPALVIVDSLRGYNAKAETAPDAASEMISKMQKVAQTYGCAWVFIHHPRKIDLKMDIKSRPDLFNKEVDILTWCQESAGAHALIQQTHSRIGFAKPKDSKISELGLRGHIKGRGEVGVWLIDREHDDETGEPIGYKRVSGVDLLTVTEKTLFNQLPVGVPMSFGKMLGILYDGNKSKKKALTRLIHPCLAAGVLIDNGTDNTTSKTYTAKGTK